MRKAYVERFGPIGSREFSLRSAIPGLYLLNSFSKSSGKKKDDGFIILLITQGINTNLSLG
ncbi:MAG: hypothetical protein Q8880_07510 [Bacteroidota bacterium]|nr:hypothetical protein [Bacteroidota bacterium]